MKRSLWVRRALRPGEKRQYQVTVIQGRKWLTLKIHKLGSPRAEIFKIASDENEPWAEAAGIMAGFMGLFDPE